MQRAAGDSGGTGRTDAGIELSADALAHAERVAARILDEIARAGGWIPFSRFMELALYAPGLGYYGAGAPKFGSGGDFVTAPELTPLYAQSLATQFAEVLEETGGDVLELGAGTGKFAADVLVELDRIGCMPRKYLILETSAELRSRQRVAVESQSPVLAARVEWIDRLPTSITGLVFGNEVLDAIPCEIVARRGGEWMRRGVSATAGNAFEWAERPLDDAQLRSMAVERLPAIEGFTSEINPAAEALTRTLCGALERGAVLLVDYGFPASELYHPQRSAGTLMCHVRHRAHTDPLVLTGLQDITAHVDFTAIAMAGVAAGAELAGFVPLARLLVNLGIAERLMTAAEPGTAQYSRRAAPVQKLLSPAEMGELFKAIALVRGLPAGLLGLAAGNQAHRL